MQSCGTVIEQYFLPILAGKLEVTVRNGVRADRDYER